MSQVIRVEDKMQSAYSYVVVAPMGKQFHPEFQPDLTPKQMLELGVFAGRYMRDCTKEFPESWFEHAKLHPDGKPGHTDDLNFFKIDASQPLSVWRAKGWLHQDDPRGWFQWYCRYFMGRRHPDDQRQIARWKNFRRHIAQIQKNCLVGDWQCRKRQRQAVLHWAYDARKL